MPCFTMVPPRGDHPVHGHFWVPIDDHNCWAWSFDYHPTRALNDSEVQAMKDGHGIHVALRARHLPCRCRTSSNDYLMDRAAQKAGISYSGIEGIAHAGRLAAGEHGPDPGPHPRDTSSPPTTASSWRASA